jgi:SAM-dependent methyltransferase
MADRRSSMRPDLDRLLDEVQADIASSDSGPNYARAYRDAERNYWSPIPGWIAELPSNIRALDVGAAYGTLAIFTKRLLNAEVVCVDAIPHYAPHALLEAENIPLVLRNVELADFSDLGTFDLIIFTEILEHLNFYPPPTLRKLKAQLRPGGKLALSTPDAASRWGRVTKYYPSLSDLPDQPDPNRPWIDDHIWQYTEDELRYVLAEAGFVVEKIATAPGADNATHLNVLCGVAAGNWSKKN